MWILIFFKVARKKEKEKIITKKNMKTKTKKTKGKKQGAPTLHMGRFRKARALNRRSHDFAGITQARASGKYMDKPMGIKVHFWKLISKCQKNLEKVSCIHLHILCTRRKFRRKANFSLACAKKTKKMSNGTLFRSTEIYRFRGGQIKRDSS